MLNITPDHMDRYSHQIQNYVDAKMRILNNQTEEDTLIYWSNDPLISREIERLKPHSKLIPFAQAKAEGICAYQEDAHIYIHANNTKFRMKQDQLALQGTHNLY